MIRDAWNKFREILRIPGRLRSIEYHLAAIRATQHASTLRCQEMPDGLRLCTIPDGSLCMVDINDLSLAPRIMAHGEWEPEITRALDRLLQPGMHVVEVGANIGWHSTRIARKIGRQGQLRCFEPNPRCRRILGINLMMNGVMDQVEIREEAVSQTSGVATLHVFPHLQGSSSLQAGANAQIGWIDGAPQSISVKTLPLDNLPTTGPIALIKIDAEGVERLIWEGMRNTLERHREVVILLEIQAVAARDDAYRAWLESILRDGWMIGTAREDGSIQPCAGFPDRLGDIFLGRRPWS